jgi:tRNA threonylcarbamoyladenosine biosynthesis protein TsaE
MQIKLDSESSDETELIGNKIGRHLKGGEVIDIKSDLGGGKTTLIRGLAKGAGSLDNVASPSFTISRVYETKKFKIYHFDFYRLNEPGLMKYEVADLLDDPKRVLVIEWSDIIKDTLPKDRLSIEIIAKSETSRGIIINYQKSLGYLIESL